MVHHRQQLHVREAEVAGIGDELVGELLPAEAEPPRLGVHLVDRERLLERFGRPAALEPGVVAPLVARPVDPRRGLRRHLGVEGERIGLQAQLPVGAVNLELVAVALSCLGDDRGPDPGRADRLQLVDPAVPAVPVAHHGDAARVRRPDGERDPLVDDLRPQALVDPLVPALSGQVQVELAQLHVTSFMRPPRASARSRRRGSRPSRGGCRARSAARRPPSRARRSSAAARSPDRRRAADRARRR